MWTKGQNAEFQKFQNSRTTKITSNSQNTTKPMIQVFQFNFRTTHYFKTAKKTNLLTNKIEFNYHYTKHCLNFHLIIRTFYARTLHFSHNHSIKRTCIRTQLLEFYFFSKHSFWAIFFLQDRKIENSWQNKANLIYQLNNSTCDHYTSHIRKTIWRSDSKGKLSI